MANITGDNNGNNLTGTALRDYIRGLGGNDNIDGLAGNDTLDGGTGGDSMSGGLGNDLFILDDVLDAVSENPGEGTDTIKAAFSFMLGNDFENLTLTGNGDFDATGNDLNNIVTGNSGDNSIDGGLGADTMAGGAGNDIFIVDDVNDRASDASGSDEVQSSVSFTLGGGIERLVLTGLGNLDGTGNSLSNTITGNNGDNLLDGMRGADTMSGGDGDDIYVVDNKRDVITGETNGTDTVRSTLKNYTLGLDLENLELTGKGNINGTGNTGDNIITGNIGRNTLTGLDGNDTLDGGAGKDKMLGGLDDDTYIVDDNGDSVTENLLEGTDEVRSSVSYRLGANLENLTLTGIANINGTGNAEQNVITGNDGDNSLDGGLGADDMTGGLGNDTYVVDDLMETVTENPGEGTDTVRSSVSYALGSDLENLALTGTDDIDGTGNADDNVITGNSGDNSIDGDAGADAMAGGAGNDTFIVDDLGDTVSDSAGTNDSVRSEVSFTLGAGLENLTLTGLGNDDGTGNALANIINGNNGNNTLSGLGGTDIIGAGDGDDFIFGGAGDDTMSGDLGADTFVFESITAGNGMDTISGFSLVDGDALDLSDLLTAYDPMTQQLEDFVQITDNGFDSFVAVDVNGATGGFNYIQVATLTNTTGMTDEDLLVLSGNLIVS